MVAKAYGLTADESTWVERAHSGEDAAFIAIYQRYERRIFAYIYRMMGNLDDAFDLTQETFIKAYRGLPKLMSTQAFNLSAWLYRIASNTCIDVIRRRKLMQARLGGRAPLCIEEATELVSHDLTGNPEASYERKETREEIASVLRRMSVTQRTALLLKEYQGMSGDEIAAVMKVSPSAVKSILFRARGEFRRLRNMDSSTLYPREPHIEMGEESCLRIF